MLAISFTLLPLAAHADLAALDDGALADVSGQDGISLQFVGFGIDGDARITYREPPGAGGSLWVEKLKVTTVDDVPRLMTDPTLIDIIDGGGLADYVNIQLPENPDSIAKSTWSLDLGVNADGNDWQLGAVVLRDVVQRGTRVRITTPPAGMGEGIALDLSTRLDIANVLIRPRGRDDPNVADPVTVAEQLNISGLHLAGSNLSTSEADPNSPFRIGDIFTQPLIIRNIQDGGTPYFNVHMDWPTAGPAPYGSVVIDNLSFKSAATGNVDFGASQIGFVQIQYLDLRFGNTP